jgi:hypothetical protein
MQEIKNIIFDLGGIFLDIETGKISPEQFHHAFVEETGLHLTYEELRAGMDCAVAVLSEGARVLVSRNK